MSSGEDVLAVTAGAAVEVFGDELEAVFALGSLAHGGFAPLVSDVDVALVLARLEPGSAGRVRRVAATVRERAPGELAGRLSLFWSDLDGVRNGGDGGRLPAVDRLDLLDHGRLLHGTDRRAPAVRPTAGELVADGARFAAERFDAGYLDELRHPGRLLARGVRPVTKAVLFPVRFGYTLASGRIGRNDAAVDWYLGGSGDGGAGAHAPLVAAAFGWRREGLAADAGELLERHLVGLYREFLDRYAESIADPDLAAALRGRRSELDR